MNSLLASFCLRFHDLQNSGQGQDLVEYALLLCLISLTLISAINGIASAVNTTFTNISASLA